MRSSRLPQTWDDVLDQGEKPENVIARAVAIAKDRRSGKTTDRSGGLQEDGHSSSSSSVAHNLAHDHPSDNSRPFMIDLGDGLGPRCFEEICSEADAEISAAHAIMAYNAGGAIQ